jgi:hypothetical protein
MDPDSAEKEKGRRAQRLLYVIMVVFTLLPFALLLLRSR